MRPAKVFILHRKNNQEEEDRAKEIRKIFATAAQMISRAVDVEISSNLKDFKDYNLKSDDMPVVIVNNNIVFTKHVPPVEYIKQLISTPQEQQKYF